MTALHAVTGRLVLHSRFPDPDPATAGRRRLALGLTAALSAAVFILALMPLAPSSPVPGSDKLHHLVAFGAMILPCALFHRRALPWILPVVIAQAGLIELVQPGFGRHREWADFVADLAGIGLGLGLGWLLRGTAGRVAGRYAARRD